MKSFLSLPVGSKIIVTVFLLSGIGHLVNPAAFASLVPPFLPEPYFWIYATGVAEIICAIGLLIRNKLAPISTVALLLIVWVGNWWFAIDMSQNGELSTIIAAWVRVPLQLPLLWWAYKSPVKQ
jgi:uncharacterized membrane protein